MSEFLFKANASAKFILTRTILLFVTVLTINTIQTGTLFNATLGWLIIILFFVIVILDTLFYKTIELYDDCLSIKRPLFFGFLAPKKFSYKNIDTITIYTKGSVVSLPSVQISLIDEKGKVELYTFVYTLIDRVTVNKLVEVLRARNVNVNVK